MQSGTAKPSVLIVEDDVGAGLALERIIAFAGFRGILASCGKDAVARIVAENLDAAVINVNLPDVNGWHVAEVVRSRFGPGVPVVMVTGDNSKDYSDQIAETRAALVIQKPPDPITVLEQIERLMQRPHADSSGGRRTQPQGSSTTPGE